MLHLVGNISECTTMHRPLSVKTKKDEAYIYWQIRPVSENAVFNENRHWEGCTLRVGVNEIMFVHVLRNCMLFRGYSLCRRSWSVRFAIFFHKMYIVLLFTAPSSYSVCLWIKLLLSSKRFGHRHLLHSYQKQRYGRNLVEVFYI